MNFVVIAAQLLPLTFFSPMGNTLSMSHRLEKCRALYLYHSDNKTVFCSEKAAFAAFLVLDLKVTYA